jgi:nucleotide-binding universal stress UspA family protein
MYDSVLVATDGSQGTTETLAHATSIARDNDATLHGLYVVDKRLYLAADKANQDEVRQSLEEEGDVALDDIAVGGEEAGVEVVTNMEEGIPHKTITDYAEREGIDLIVMGTHGRTGRDRLAHLGSVTERVVENTDTPIMVVRMGSE